MCQAETVIELFVSDSGTDTCIINVYCTDNTFVDLD
jgi:hypothetical protein